jgi:hypothetical protein
MEKVCLYCHRFLFWVGFVFNLAPSLYRSVYLLSQQGKGKEKMLPHRHRIRYMFGSRPPVIKHYQLPQGWPQHRVVPDPAPVLHFFSRISDVARISRIIERVAIV